MSSDAFSTPVRKYDFGKDGGLTGQSRVIQPQYRMPDHLVWSRTETLTAAAGANTYLPFDCPPLPVGSIIRGTMLATCGATDGLGIGVSSDWGLATPTVTSLIVVQPGGTSLTVTLHVAVKGRNSYVAFGEAARNSSAASETAGTNIDFGVNNRFALYVNEITAIIVYAGLVEVFIPRVYR